MLKTPNQPTLELASHELWAVIAIENKGAEEYLLYTGSIFHPVVKTQPNDCCRHHNLRETLGAKFCPFRNPLPQPWSFCGRLFCTNPVCCGHHLSTLEVPAWGTSPSSAIESHYKIFFLSVLHSSHTGTHLLKFVSKMGIPVRTHLVHTRWVQQSSWQSSLFPTQSPSFFLNQFWKCNSICQESCPLPRTNHKSISNWHHYLFIQKEQGALNGPQSSIYPKT